LGADRIRELLADRPHAALSVEPTPLHRLANISSQLGREVYILREDLTGFGIGGNKVRKLDYLVADALSLGADTLVTCAASSFSRNAAAAAVARGLELHVLILGEPEDHNPLSRALFEQCAATLHYIPKTSDDALPQAESRLLSELRDAGRVVYAMPPGGSTEIGTLGYIRVFEQIARQSASTGIQFDRVILPTGSAGTQAGLVIGQCVSGYPTCVIGMAVSQAGEVQHRRVLELAESTSGMLGVDFDPSTVHIDDRFLGDGYAMPSEGGREAVKRFARFEGVLLDQDYVGKAAAGLIQTATSGEIGEHESTLLIHTGGSSGLYY